MVNYTFSISYFLQNTTVKPQKLPAAYKKQAATNAACSFRFASLQLSRANSRSILPVTSRLSSSIANAQISCMNPISFLRLRLNENLRQQILSISIIASTPSSIRFGIKNIRLPYLISYAPPSSLPSISSWNIFLTASGSRRMPSFVSGIIGTIFVIIFISFLFAFRYCRHVIYTYNMPDSAGRKTSAERESPAAGKDSEALKQRKERTRRRIRLMHRGRFFFLIDGRETAVNLRLLIGFEVAGRTLGVRNPSTSGEGERKFTESSLVYSIPDF